MDANATREPSGPRAGAWEWAFVFASGFITLIVEIIGAKLQGPFFGNSHFVWTNQILVTLLALAAGAWLGGRLADRGRGRAWIPALFLIAAVWLCLLFPVLEKANYFFLRFHVGPGAIMASVFFYLAPLAALGRRRRLWRRCWRRAIVKRGGLRGGYSGSRPWEAWRVAASRAAS